MLTYRIISGVFLPRNKKLNNILKITLLSFLTTYIACDSFLGDITSPCKNFKAEFSVVLISSILHTTLLKPLQSYR